MAFGCLALPLAALNLPFYVYLPTFYVRDLGIDLAVVGGILLVARVLDVVTDPIIGTLGDRTSTRFGRRRPWVLASVPLLLLASWQLFLPPDDAGGLYLFVWSSLAYLAWTMILLAYSAWGAELSPDYNERSRIFGARESFVISGCADGSSTAHGDRQRPRQQHDHGLDLLDDGCSPAGRHVDPALADR